MILPPKFVGGLSAAVGRGGPRAKHSTLQTTLYAAIAPATGKNTLQYIKFVSQLTSLMITIILF